MFGKDVKEGIVPIEVILILLERHLKSSCNYGERLRFALGVSKMMSEPEFLEPTDPKSDPNPIDPIC
jgi:hypothetical protein